MFGFRKKHKTESIEIPEETQIKPVEESNPLMQQQIEVPQESGEDTQLKILSEKIETLKLQYENIKEKLDNIEEMVKEIYRIAKS